MTRIPFEGDLVDRAVADGTTYYYYLERNGKITYGPVALKVEDRPLPPLAKPEIFIDKVNYYLEVRDGGNPVKRYPIAMGKSRGRKLQQDRASTPEGRYRIYGVQPEATFYKAYDLNYPNQVDRIRYDFARRHGLAERGIGGEIQIHGGGVDYNWTWGCVGLKNEDMDELFSRPEIAAGVPVTIVGENLTREDLRAIDSVDRARLRQALGSDSPEALGRFQLQHDLPLTCQPDARTQRVLGLLR